MLCVKQGGIKSQFFWFDSTGDWIPVSLTIGEYPTHEGNNKYVEISHY